MADVLTAQQRADWAERRVERFVARFEPGYRDLLCHVALPLVLTPELVSYLRNEFLRGIPWIAEVDLLLSDLCSPVGYELYAIDTDVRAYLLKQCTETFGSARTRQVAKLLLSYVSYLSDSQSVSDREQLESQQWAAMVYLGPTDRQKAVDEIVQRFQNCIAVAPQPVGADLLSRAEMARLAQLIETFRMELSNYPELIEFAALVSDVQLRSVALAAERVERIYEVGAQRLQLPDEMKQKLREGDRIQPLDVPIGLVVKGSADGINTSIPVANSSSVQDEPALADLFPPLQLLEFEYGELIDAANLPEEHPTAFPPPLKTAIFQVATISLPQQTLEVFEFQTAKIEQERAGIFRRLQWVVNKSRAQARRFKEPLTDELTLEMVAISGGTFLMGSPDNEPERSPSEGPQHEVRVSDFFMGRYPVTQAQWRFVANLPQVNREISADPSNFKGNALPVENVSWYDAVEFCDRLSIYTDRAYRLPTEAEWEYACRANTTTPFHFGKTLTSEVANYNGNYVYANGPKGEYRKTTTPVDQFEIANAFGLCDMHGNVWEWCEDRYGSYDQTPTDGSAWITDEKEANRVLRGGSWDDYPRVCRSAQRNTDAPDFAFDYVGFRVSCSAPRT